MSTDNGKRRGRPKVADDGASVTLRIDSGHLELADGIAADLGRVITGLCQTRGDVLRTAIQRGLQVLRVEVDERLGCQKDGR